MSDWKVHTDVAALHLSEVGLAIRVCDDDHLLFDVNLNKRVSIDYIGHSMAAVLESPPAYFLSEGTSLDSSGHLIFEVEDADSIQFSE